MKARPSSPRPIHTLAELDEALGAIASHSENDEVLRKRLSEIRFQFAGFSAFTKLNPFHEMYRQRVSEAFQQVRGAVYRAADEGLDQQDIAARARWATPYGLPPRTTGQVLMSYGFLIKAFDIHLGGRVLEIGCGEGTLSYQFAKMGYRLTALDINASSVRITEKHLEPLTASEPRPVVEQGDAQAFASSEPFDGIVFHSSFHHVLNHHALLERLIRTSLTPTGKIAFAGEPVFPLRTYACPYPWGLRLDGESLRAIRQFGWMELGFSWRYFNELLQRVGLRGVMWPSSEPGITPVIICTRTRPFGLYGRWPFLGTKILARGMAYFREPVRS